MRRASPWWAAGVLVVAGCASMGGEPRSASAPAAAHAPAATAPARTTIRRAAGPPRRLVDVANQDPALADLALALRAQTAAARGDAQGAGRAATALDAQMPDSIWRGSTWLVVARVRHRTGDLPGARDALVAARATLPPSDRRTQAATLELAEVTYALGDDAAASQMVHELRAGKPRGIVRRRARRLADRIREHHPDWWASPDVQLDEGELRLTEGDGRGALDEAFAVLAAAPTGATHDRARWLRARAERAVGQRQQAEATCLALAADAPPALAAEALATAARWRWNADDDVGAARLFGQMLKRFPDDDGAPDALYALGRIRQESGDVPGAIDAYSTLVRRFPESKLVEEARWRAGWVRYAAGDYGGAADAFGTLGGEANRRARLAGGYWQARALEQLGEGDEARRRLGTLAETNPDTYYGLLARARLEGRDAIPDEPTPSVRDTLAVPPPFPDALPGAHAARARALQAAGLHRLARLELDAIGDAAPTPLLLQAYAAARAPGSAIRLARSADAGPQWTYPLGFWDLVEPAAETRGIDPLFVTALIRQESLFFPDAVSPADAHGLMQLLPRTAREVAMASGQPLPDVHALHEPEVNVTLGTTLLRRLLDRYGGSRVRALAAYNAGEDAVAKWDRRFGDRPEDEYVERITYRETRDYVKSVLDHWAAYRGLYAASPAATSLGSPPNAPLDMITMTSPARDEPTR